MTASPTYVSARLRCWFVLAPPRLHPFLYIPSISFSVFGDKPFAVCSSPQAALCLPTFLGGHSAGRGGDGMTGLVQSSNSSETNSDHPRDAKLQPLNPTSTRTNIILSATMSNHSVWLRDYSISSSPVTKPVIPEEEEPLAPHSEDETDDGDTLQEGHGVSIIPNGTTQPEWDDGIPVLRSWRSFFIRALALLCAMSLSIGSHLFVPHI